MKLSLILMTWNTSHLLARTLRTLDKQTLDRWELIIVDDMSEDDVNGAIDSAGLHNVPVVHYHRLEHDMGMRGNTASINFGLEQAVGDIVMWSTPEVMLPPGVLQAAYDIHMATPDQRLWVTVPSHGITADLQLKIDTVDWQDDIHSIKELALCWPPEHWNSVWFHVNFHEHGRRDTPSKQSLGTEFGNNQTVAVLRSEWDETIEKFPLFLDYGSDDPWVCNKRKKYGFTDYTLWDQEAYHQWHTTCAYWQALGKAPNWNKNGHTTSNIANDPDVPDGGTCEIWDRGDRSQFTEAEKAEHLALGPMVEATGFRYKL